MFIIGHHTNKKAPRRRGKGRVGVAGVSCGGITPAWAGKSVRRRPRSYQRRNHPRMGGEKSSQPLCLLWMRGSPPRGRGKERSFSCPTAFTGITPAWAGKRFGGLRRACVPGDHPRVGGEKCGFCHYGAARSRITPAWAGKRNRFCMGFTSYEDHPRVGGEKHP